MKNVTINCNSLLESISQSLINVFSEVLRECIKADSLSEKKAEAEAEFTKARLNAKLTLGICFDAFCSIYMKSNYIEKLKTRDYLEIIRLYEELRPILDGKSLKTVEEIADVFTEIYHCDITNLSVDELSAFVKDCIEDMALSIETTTPHKKSLDLYKIDAKQISFVEGRIPGIDTRRFYDPKEKTVPMNGIPVLKTSEGGINRLFMSKGIKGLSIDFKSLNPKDADDNVFKSSLLRDGLYDTKNGDYYLPAFQSVSGSRQGIVIFCCFPGMKYTQKTEIIEKIKELWYTLNGFDNWNEYALALGKVENDTIMVNMAKGIARTGTQGSSSHHISTKNPELYDKVIRNANVSYVEDTVTVVNKNCRTFDNDGNMTVLPNHPREITDADGQGIINYTQSATIACILNLISKTEYEDFLNLWSVFEKDINNIILMPMFDFNNESIPAEYKTYEKTRLANAIKLDKIIKKIPSVFQIRHGEKKGLLVRWNIETIEELKDVDYIIPRSVRKFIGAAWSEYDLDICAYQKSKVKQFVNMNQQFINALSWENPGQILNLVKHWEEYEKASINNIARAMEFHHILASSDSCEDDNTIADNASLVVEAIKAMDSLINDWKIVQLRRAQYESFTNNMAIGKIMVPGQYTYMIFDPNYALNKWFGLNLPTLQSKEYYFCAKECHGGLFRSPLISSYEAKKVTFVDNEEYRYLQNVVIFNGYDAGADDLGGGDHDGDRCLVCTDDNEWGKLIIDGIMDLNYVVMSSSNKAKYVPFTYDNFLKHLEERGTVRDRTGEITNYGSNWKDMSNHLRGCLYYAKASGCTSITFVHPQSFGRGLGCNVKPHKENDTYVVRAFVKCVIPKAKRGNLPINLDVSQLMPTDVWCPGDKLDGPVGKVSFEKIEELINEYDIRNDDIRNRQGEEIDSAKTGAIVNIPDIDKCPFVAQHTVFRKGILDKNISDSNIINSYVAYSPLGIMHSYVTQKVMPTLENELQNDSPKTWALEEALTAEEHAYRANTYTFDGKTGTIESILAEMRTEYNRAAKTYSDMGETDSIGILKYDMYNKLHDMATTLNVPIEVIAACAYFVSYNRDSQKKSGLSFAWILAGELLAVFSRRGKGVERVILPKSCTSAYVKDNVLYANDRPFRRLTGKVKDGDVMVHMVNDSIFALIYRENKEFICRQPRVASNAIYTVTLVGFKYNNQSVESCKSLLKDNNFIFKIDIDEMDRPSIYINGIKVCALTLTDSSQFDLYGKTVKIVNKSKYCPNEEIVFKNASISNVKLVVIG